MSCEDFPELVKVLKDVLKELQKITVILGNSAILPSKPEERVGSGDGPATPVPAPGTPVPAAKKKSKKHDIHLSDRAKALYVKAMQEKHDPEQDSKAESEQRFKTKWYGLNQEKQAKWKLKAARISSAEEIAHMRPKKKTGYQYFTHVTGKKLVADGVAHKNIFADVGRLWSNLGDTKKKEYQKLSEEHFRTEVEEFDNILSELPDELQECVGAEEKKLLDEKKEKTYSKKKKQLDIVTALNMSGVSEKSVRSSKSEGKSIVVESDPESSDSGELSEVFDDMSTSAPIYKTTSASTPIHKIISRSAPIHETMTVSTPIHNIKPPNKLFKSKSKVGQKVKKQKRPAENISEEEPESKKKKKTSPKKSQRKTSSSSESDLESDNNRTVKKKILSPSKANRIENTDSESEAGYKNQKISKPVTPSGSRSKQKSAVNDSVTKFVKEDDGDSSDSDSDSIVQPKIGGKGTKAGKSPVKSSSKGKVAKTSDSKSKQSKGKSSGSPSKTKVSQKKGNSSSSSDSDSDEERPSKKTAKTPSKSLNTSNNPYVKQLMQSDSDSDEPTKKKLASPKKSKFTALNKKTNSTSSGSSSDSD